MAKSELEQALERLEALRRDGLLSDSEYEAARRRAILQSGLAAGAPSHEESGDDDAEPVAGDEGGSASGPVGLGRRQASRRGLWGRFKASRWWVKAILVVIGLFVLLIVLAAVFGEEEDDTGGAVPAATSEEATPSEAVAETSQPESTPVSTPTNEPTARATADATPGATVTPTTPATPATPDEPGLGDLVEVGSLELTVLEVDTYDAVLEDSNYRVRVQVRKLKGDAYDFTGSSFKVIDAGGVAHDHDTSCRDCPGNLFPEGTGIELLGTSAAERWVYFEIRSSDAPVQLRFKPTSRTAAVLVSLPSTPHPVTRPSRETTSTPEPAPSTPEPAATSTPEPARSTPEPAAATPVTPASVRDQIEDCLSPWDGNHNGFEDQVRSGLNDEDSMETHSTRFQVADDDGDGYVAIVMEYSAENALGGRVKTVATGLLNYRTCNVTVLDPGY